MKTIETTITGHKVVSRDTWIAARKELLTKEKESTRLRDQLSAWVNQRLSPVVLEDQNRQFRHTGGVSRGNRAYGFLPAFMDALTGAIYLSRFADGRIAPVHVLDGLPANLITTKTPSGTVIATTRSVIAGFVRKGRFYTREEAANALH